MWSLPLLKVLKIVLAVIWNRLESGKRKLIRGHVETIEGRKLERNARKVSNVDFGLHDFEFSCKNSPNPNIRFDLAKNRCRCLPSMSLPTVIEDCMENEMLRVEEWGDACIGHEYPYVHPFEHPEPIPLALSYELLNLLARQRGGSRGRGIHEAVPQSAPEVW